MNKHIDYEDFWSCVCAHEHVYVNCAKKRKWWYPMWHVYLSSSLIAQIVHFTTKIKDKVLCIHSIQRLNEYIPIAGDIGKVKTKLCFSCFLFIQTFFSSVCFLFIFLHLFFLKWKCLLKRTLTSLLFLLFCLGEGVTAYHS